MKVVFPCSGSLVLLKQDFETLKAFYNTSMMTSKMSAMYQNANTIIQIGHLNYVPKTSSLVLYKAHPLTIEKMRKILGIFREEKEQQVTPPAIPAKPEIADNNAQISDEDLLSNPFFQTLKPM